MARALAAAIKSNDFSAVQKLLPDIPVYPALWSDGRWRQRRRGEGGVQMTHVMLAVVHNRPKILRLLLDSGADVLLDAACGRDYETALHVACSRGRVAVAKMLLDAPAPNAANPNAADALGRTPLHVAAYAGHADLIDLLIMEEAESDPRDNRKDTPLILACRKGVTVSIKALIEGGGFFDFIE